MPVKNLIDQLLKVVQFPSLTVILKLNETLDIFYLFIYSKINVFALLILRHELDIVTHNIKKKKKKKGLAPPQTYILIYCQSVYIVPQVLYLCFSKNVLYYQEQCFDGESSVQEECILYKALTWVATQSAGVTDC